MGECTHNPCKFSHDWTAYFKSKPADLPFVEGYTTEEPFVQYAQATVGGAETDSVGRAIDLKTRCPVYADLGYCPFGWKCRFLGGHVRKVQEGEGADKSKMVGEWEMTTELTREEEEGWKNGETNWPDHKVFGELRRCIVSYCLAFLGPR